jgi:hypothetical protein
MPPHPLQLRGVLHLLVQLRQAMLLAAVLLLRVKALVLVHRLQRLQQPLLQPPVLHRAVPLVLATDAV